MTSLGPVWCRSSFSLLFILFFKYLCAIALATRHERNNPFAWMVASWVAYHSWGSLAVLYCLYIVDRHSDRWLLVSLPELGTFNKSRGCSIAG
jgi:hypothetical protein